MSRKTVFTVLAAASLGAAIVGIVGIGSAALAGRTPPADSSLTAIESPLPTPTHDTIRMPSAAPVDTGRPALDDLHPDDVLVTYDEILAFLQGWMPDADDALREQGARVNKIVVDCMAEKGFWWDPRLAMSAGRLVYVVDSPAGFAMEGSTGAGDAYRWEDAGCWGLAVHEAGTGN